MNDERSAMDEGSCRRQVSELLASRGMRQTAQLLGMSIQTMLAIAVGARVTRGSLALARERLAMLERDEQ